MSLRCMDHALTSNQFADVDTSDDVTTTALNAGKGLVGGVLWYFPCENGCETIPLESGTGLSSSIAAPQGELVMTQWEGMTQANSNTRKGMNIDGMSHSLFKKAWSNMYMLGVLMCDAYF